MAFAADFSKGDVVALTQDEPLYFKDAIYRQGSKGETFTVYSQNAATEKVFVVTKDDKGGVIALNLSKDALALIRSAPRPKTTPLPDVSGPGKLGGLLGMPWGTTMDAAKKVMLSRGGTTFTGASSDSTTLIFEGGSFSGHECESVALSFLDGALYRGCVTLKEDSVFDEIDPPLQKKYGMSNVGGEGYRAWYFPSFQDQRESLNLMLSNEGKTVLFYTNELLKQKADVQHYKNLNMKDL
jgi:hypothetical protein